MYHNQILGNAAPGSLQLIAVDCSARSYQHPNTCLSLKTTALFLEGMCSTDIS